MCRGAPVAEATAPQTVTKPPPLPPPPPPPTPPPPSVHDGARARDGSALGPALERARAALLVERDYGHADLVASNARFSDFARRYFAHVGQLLAATDAAAAASASLAALEWRTATAPFGQYKELGPAAREELVRRSLACLDRLRPRSAAATSHGSHGRLLLPRQAAGAQAQLQQLPEHRPHQREVPVGLQYPAGRPDLAVKPRRQRADPAQGAAPRGGGVVASARQPGLAVALFKGSGKASLHGEEGYEEEGYDVRTQWSAVHEANCAMAVSGATSSTVESELVAAAPERARSRHEVDLQDQMAVREDQRLLLARPLQEAAVLREALASRSRSRSRMSAAGCEAGSAEECGPDTHGEKGSEGRGYDHSEAQQTDEWFAARRGRLTASTFSAALGFWPRGRVELWEEKIGLREPFRGNAATRWGTKSGWPPNACPSTSVMLASTHALRAGGGARAAAVFRPTEAHAYCAVIRAESRRLAGLAPRAWSTPAAPMNPDQNLAAGATGDNGDALESIAVMGPAVCIGHTLCELAHDAIQ
eukprot:SM000155S01643  [mRNA]  locus=s155:37433:41851:- [translate_table: standard]